MGISLKKFINDYTPAGALYKAATGGGQLTDDAGKAWSKAIDDTGISKTLGDAGQAAINAANVGLVGVVTGKEPIEVVKESASGGLVGVVTGKEPIEVVKDTWEETTQNAGSNVTDTVKKTVQNVTKGVSSALPVLAIGGAAVILAAILFKR